MAYKRVLDRNSDIIIDFMNYNLDEYASRIPLLLSGCNHYIWFSSSRVYAESDEPLSEDSPRLLDTSIDKDFLSTNRYALRKARQENLLFNSGFDNYTIIRPYITYNDNRLQLGIFEKEQWLYRILKGRPLVIPKMFLDKTTTLTYGADVAGAIADIIGLQNTKKHVFNIACSDTIKWKDLAELYCRIIKSEAGISPTILVSENIKAIEMLYEGGYNTIYDRNYNRFFNSDKIEKTIQRRIDYTPIKSGVAKCLTCFLRGPRKFLSIDPYFEAYQDYLTDSETSKEEFYSDSDYNTYLSVRNSNLIANPGLSKEIIEELI